jgi:hypothetical protein
MQNTEEEEAPFFVDTVIAFSILSIMATILFILMTILRQSQPCLERRILWD